ncbi:MAG TPA: acyl carrier protein [Polyangia bacterium]|jgi:acyl carrier protein
MKQFDRQEFTTDLVSILAKMAKVPAESIALQDDLREDVGLDSLQSMELLSRISEKWEVDVEMEDMIEVKTVGHVVEFMSRLATEQGA